MIDLHTHTFFSDGVLSPAELVYRCMKNGCEAVALTDHADYSNLGFLIESALYGAERLNRSYDIHVIAGVELTYIPPGDIAEMISRARQLGAELVVVHGESPVERVPPGTNREAVQAGCDILAHPGDITESESEMAAEKGVFLELTTRRGHCRGNRNVAEKAAATGCKMVLNTDSHAPEDLLDERKVSAVLKQCRLEKDYYETLLGNSREILNRVKRQEKI